MNIFFLINVHSDEFAQICIMASIEIVVEKLDLFELFGKYTNLPREICALIESHRIDAVKRACEFFKEATGLRCTFCVAYVPVKLLRTKQAIVSQANKKKPSTPRISHLLLIDGQLYDLFDYVSTIVRRINGLPAFPIEDDNRMNITNGFNCCQQIHAPLPRSRKLNNNAQQPPWQTVQGRLHNGW